MGYFKRAGGMPVICVGIEPKEDGGSHRICLFGAYSVGFL